MSGNGQQQPGAQPEAVQIDIDWSDEPTPVYANGAQIVHTHREFAIALTEFAPFAGRRAKPYPPRHGEVAEQARVVSTVRMTPDVFFQLIAAGAENWNKFVDTYGKAAGAEMPKFQIVGDAKPPSMMSQEGEAGA
ncbi:MAG: hypothetical protein H6719_09660 [Sandaracinaceae bacterium]|nr:hypothetical protein [Sandaracinaceae bacterium]